MHKWTVGSWCFLHDDELPIKYPINEQRQCPKALHVVVKKDKDLKLGLFVKSGAVFLALQVPFLLFACVSGSFSGSFAL